MTCAMCDRSRTVRAVSISDKRPATALLCDECERYMDEPEWSAWAPAVGVEP